MILIVSNTQDVTADFVVAEFHRRGTPFARLNTDEFPTNARASYRIASESPPSAQLRWLNRDRVLDFGEVDAVWYRRPVAPVPDERVTEPALRRFAIDESYEFLRGLWLSRDCYWMSHPDAIRRAEHKLVQLGIARDIGFRLPHTLVTNDPEAAHEFWEANGGAVVAKPLYLGFIEEREHAAFVYTSEVRAEHMAHVADVAVAPCIFQQRIRKVFDVRVTVVGTRVFSARIDTDLPESMPDWRAAEVNTLRHSAYRLPADVEQRCIELVRRLGLEFGALDFGVEESGAHTFFEINANGQWAWLERALDFPISAAIADALTSRHDT